MHHGIEFPLRKKPVHQPTVPDVALDHFRGSPERFHIGPLHRRIVVIIEFIKHRHLRPTRQQTLNGVRSNEPGSPGNKNFHDAAYPAAPTGSRTTMHPPSPRI